MVPACAAKLDGASRADFRTVSTVWVGSKKVVGNQPSDDLTHRDTSCGYGNDRGNPGTRRFRLISKSSQPNLGHIWAW